jgi:hypothetical protein
MDRQKTRKKQLQVQPELSRETHAKLTFHARRRGISARELARQILEKWARRAADVPAIFQTMAD